MVDPCNPRCADPMTKSYMRSTANGMGDAHMVLGGDRSNKGGVHQCFAPLKSRSLTSSCREDMTYTLAKPPTITEFNQFNFT